MRAIRQFTFVLAIAVAAIVGLSAMPSSTEAGASLPGWGPLTSCYDVSGDGYVDLSNDILSVILKFNTQFGEDDDYALLYDQNGDGVVDLSNDILSTVLAFNPGGVSDCTETDRQVIEATVAILPFQDRAVAEAAGYVQSTQYVGNMGIHMYNLGYQTSYPDFASQMDNPVGLVYTNAGTLIGAWYTVASPDVCAFFGVPNPESCPTAQPEGFAGPEDFTADTGAIQQAWHFHTGLCGGGWGTPSAWVVETFSTSTESDCLAGNYGSCPCAWFEQYGWMMHLYNFIPNPEGRFLRWNTILSTIP